MQLGLLGPLTLRGDDGAELRVPAAAKERAVLILLGLRAPQTVSPADLMAFVWGDHPPRTAAKSVQTYIAALRRELPAGSIVTGPGGYRLNIRPDELDVTRFEDRVRDGFRALEELDAGQAVAWLAEGIEMWRGQPLSEVESPAGMAERARLDELLRGAQETLMDARLATGEDASLIGDLEAAVAAEPLRERRWEQLMIALYRTGRQTDALRSFQRLRRVLADELGLEPGQTARELESAILAHDPALNVMTRQSQVRARLGGRYLPRGNVTFVVSNVEGSTSLAHRLGHRYPRMVEEHRRILRAAMISHAGTEVGTQGDGFLFAFSDAAMAIAACIESQAALAKYAWAPDGVVRVRLGIHSGIAEPTGNEYLSVAVPQVVRITAAGHGGQILCSASTASIVRHSLPVGASLVDRGLFLLVGFDAPERLFQVVNADLESAFPPLRASPARSQVWPNVRTSFVGRLGELEALGPLLERAGLLTMVGPGGVGKTRLAGEVASRHGSQFDAGVMVADMTPLEDPGAVITTIAAAFSVRPVAGFDPLDAVCRTLAGRTALLILDGCEDVSAAASAAVESLLDGTSGLTILATSRQPLGVSGEQVWRVSPLGLPARDADQREIGASEAVRLFIERARLSRPDLSLTPANGKIVAAICRAVDGLPLALELAAARVAAQSLDDLARRLVEGLDDLDKGHGSGDHRHTSLHATIAWSYRRLDQEEAALLRWLSVFAGGFPIEAVEAVSPTGNPRETLIRLVKKSLVTWDWDAGRYRILDTIRHFSKEHLKAAVELDLAERAHARFYHSLARKAESDLTGPEQARTLERLSLDHDNLRRALNHFLDQDDGAEAALEMLAALRRYWFLRSDLLEWTTRIDRLLQREDPGVSSLVRGKALVAATLSAAYVDAAAARRWGEMGLAVARLAGDDVSASEASSLLAVISYFLGAPDPGLGQRALAVARRAGDPVLIGEALFGAAMSHMAEPARACELYEEAVSVTGRSGDRFFQYFTLGNLGLLHQQLGNLRAAHDYLEQAVGVGAELGYRDPLVMSSLGRVLTDRGLLQQAYERLDAAIRFPQTSPYQSAGAIRGAAHLAASIQDWHSAARLYGFADTLLVRSGHGTWGDEPLYERDRAMLLDRLGDRFNAEYQAGGILSWEQAVELARTLETVALETPGTSECDAPPHFRWSPSAKGRESGGAPR